MSGDRDQRRKKPVGRAAREQASGKRRNLTEFPFKVEDGRVWRNVERVARDGGSREGWVPFASEVNVLALTRSADGKEWGRLIEVVDRDGMRHLWAMPLSLTAGSGEEIRGHLHSLGMELEPGRDPKTWLLEYLVSAEPGRRARCVHRIGWHDGVFVLPDQTFGERDDAEEVFLQGFERPDHAFNVAGVRRQRPWDRSG